MHTTAGSPALRLAGALWLIAGVWYLVTEAVVAAQIHGYRYWADYISDLGQPGRSPWASWMNSAFIAQGVAFALGAALVVAAMRLGSGGLLYFGLAATYGVGSAAVGLFPSGGADTQAFVHVVGATAAIGAGNLAVLCAGVVFLRRSRFRTLGISGVTLGIVGLTAGGLLLLNGVLDARLLFDDGAWERTAIYTIIGWQLLAGVTVLRQPHRTRELS
ncbi:MAG: DUF998 domain-containing protein [Mycobacterium sp.]